MRLLLAVLPLFFLFSGHTVFAQDKTESVYDRVLRTGTIRCGYAVWPPYFIKDANTGAMSGMFHDYVEEMADMLSLKIEWSEEMGWGDYIAALKGRRIDAFCPFTFPNAQRARESDFTTPILYVGMEAIVRADDARFDNAPDKINNPAITIVSMEGATPQIMAYSDFPKATKLDLPQLATTADQFMHVIDGKADVAFAEAMSALEFIKANPGKLKIVSLRQPLRFSGTSIALLRGEDDFRRMLDHATREMLYTGKIEKIVQKYETQKGLLRRVAPPYVTEE